MTADTDVNLVAVFADDEMIDNLDTFAGHGDAVAALLVGWRDQVTAQPCPELIDLDRACALVRAGAGHRPLPRRRLFPAAAVAAAVAVLCTGVLLGGIEQACPGDSLWPVAQALQTERAESALAASRTQQRLDRAKSALAAGHPELATRELLAANADLAAVLPDDGRPALLDVQMFLAAKAAETPLGVPVDPASPLRRDPARVVPPGAGLGVPVLVPIVRVDPLPPAGPPLPIVIAPPAPAPTPAPVSGPVSSSDGSGGGLVSVSRLPTSTSSPAPSSSGDESSDGSGGGDSGDSEPAPATLPPPPEPSSSPDLAPATETEAIEPSTPPPPLEKERGNSAVALSSAPGSPTPPAGPPADVIDALPGVGDATSAEAETEATEPSTTEAAMEPAAEQPSGDSEPMTIDDAAPQRQNRPPSAAADGGRPVPGSVSGHRLTP